MSVTNGVSSRAYSVAMELPLKLAIDNLRAATVEHRMEATRLSSLSEIGATLDVRTSAAAELGQLRRRIQAELTEVTKLESNKP